MSAAVPPMRTPLERWGTCCPSDPECDHSFMDERECSDWMRTPISDEVAAEHESWVDR